MSGSARPKPKPSVLLGPDGETPTGDLAKEFRARHRYLPYTMHFNRAKQAVLNNRNLDLKWRVLEAATLNCWANFRDYIADENGRPANLSDIARWLGEDTQRVSEAVAELIEESYLRRTGVRAGPIFVIDDPALERQSSSEEGEGTANDFPDGSGRSRFRTSRKELAKAEAFWEKNHPDRFQIYQKAAKEAREKEQAFQAALDEKRQLREEMLAAYWASQQGTAEAEQAPEHTDAKADFPTRPGSIAPDASGKMESEFPTRPGKSPDPSGEENGASLFGSKVLKAELASFAATEPAESTPEALVSEAVERSGLELPGNRIQAIRHAGARFGQVKPEQREAVLGHFEGDLRQLNERRESRPKTWGIVVTAMNDAIAVARSKPLKRPQQQSQTSEAPAMSLAEQIRSAEEWIEAMPDHPQTPEVRRDLNKLRAQLPKTQQAGGSV